MLTDESWVDLWPGYFGVDGDHEPSGEQIAQFEAYWNTHVRDRDLWQDD